MSRMDKVNMQIKKTLGPIIDSKLRNTNINGIVTVTKVDTSPDFKTAKVFVSMLGVRNRKECLHALKKASGFLRSMLAKEANFRRTPELVFVFDESVEYGTRINVLINDIKKELDRSREKQEQEKENQEEQVEE